jgi:hypothetical protein
MLLVIGVVAFVAVIAGLGVWYLLSQNKPGGQAGSTLVDLSGTSDAVSESFVARSGWQIVWETEGDRLEISIRGAGAVDIGTVVTQDGPGSGITTPVPSGDFVIEVTAEGPWAIQVIQGD